ncbi:hypothetical protein LSUE1_G002517, partial [Lachnellula suecica]
MPQLLLPTLVFLCALFVPYITAQSSSDGGYIGYTLASTGDPESAVYDTADTSANVSSLTIPDPDVFLNASVFVGEISLVVENITAQVNLQAQVLNLLYFNAGVDASIDRVSLLIQNISAHVILEARLENLVNMISDVLDSLDLQPVLATLGQDLSSIVNTTVGAVGSLGGSSTAATTTSTVSKRSLVDWELTHNILYSINDYSGNTHTNRILAQNGSIVDQSVDNSGSITSQREVGSFKTDMTFNGVNTTVTRQGQKVREEEYVYSPYSGLNVVSAVYTDRQGVVVGTQ